MKKQEKISNRRTQGTFYESVAKAYLEEKSYKILEMNYRCKIGEIDIIAQDEAYIVFIEVKFRNSLKLGYPREAVNWRKQQKIIKAAYFYLMGQKKTAYSCRFDVIEILGDQLAHLKNAFGI